MTVQLLVFIIVFFVLMIVMIGRHARKFNERKKEVLLSREFWMFLGSIVIVLASFQIVFTTSIPVFNSLFRTHIAPPLDRTGFYNHWQAPFARLSRGKLADFLDGLKYRQGTRRLGNCRLLAGYLEGNAQARQTTEP